MLIGGLEMGGVEIITTTPSSTTTGKPRLRSLTPSAEKLRVSTLQQQQQVKVIANGNESSKDQVRILIFEKCFFLRMSVEDHWAL